jgi:hypothetical protein
MRGFDTFWDCASMHPHQPPGCRLMPPWIPLRILLTYAAYCAFRPALVSPITCAQEIVAQATGWLAAQAQPFFLWLHFMDVHYPLSPLSSTCTHPPTKGFPGAAI